MKIVICWSHISGYITACWRALAATPGVEVFVLAFESDSIAPFDPTLLGNIPHRLMSEAERHDADFVRRQVFDQNPDLIYVTGWFHPAYRKVITDPSAAKVKKVLAMDTPFRGDLRQRIGRPLLRPLLRHFDRAVVSGERGYAYARFLGFTEQQIRRGVYAIDYDAFAPCLAQRQNRPDGWPRTFLYVGRYVEDKAIDVLVKGYEKYRAASADPWGLVCCGRGPLAGMLKDRPGITDLGFIPPVEQPAMFAGAGAFVIASRYEPWGAAIAEAAASGLPLICSNACSAIVDLVRDNFNGYTFATDDADMLAGRMTQVASADVATWGERSQHYAAAYSASVWPGRVFDGYL